MNAIRTMKVTLFAVALGLPVVSCGREETVPDTNGPAVEIEVHVVRLEATEDLYQASGTLKARQTATVTSQIPGYVRELRVRAGDTVDAGDTLVVLAGEEVRARWNAAKAGLVEAEESEIEARSGLKSAEARAEIAQSTFDRFKQLEEKRAVTAQEMDEVESRRLAADAERAAAEARLRRVRAGLERARAQVAAAEAVWDHTNVRAPYRGRVIERHIDVGNLAMPGTPLLTIEQDGPLMAEVALTESLAGRVAVGDQARVWLDASGDGEVVTGTVHEVSPAIDPRSRAFVVKVHLGPEVDARRYAPGRFVRVSFDTGTAERLLVPQSSIVRRGQLELVYVVQDGRARLRLVTLGRVFDGVAEVISGLDIGDVIVEQAMNLSGDGARVKGSS